MQGKITLVHSLSQKNPWVEEEVIVKELIEDSEGLTVDEDEWNFEVNKERMPRLTKPVRNLQLGLLAREVSHKLNFQPKRTYR